LRLLATTSRCAEKARINGGAFPATDNQTRLRALQKTLFGE